MFRSRAEAASHLKSAVTCSGRGELGWLERALQSLFLGKELYATEGKIGRRQGLGHSQKKSKQAGEMGGRPGAVLGRIWPWAWCEAVRARGFPGREVSLVPGVV